MSYAIALSFLVAALAPTIVRFAGRASPWILAILPASIFAWFLSLTGRVREEGSIVQQITWVPGLDANLTFHLDGLSLLFALLVSGIGILIVLYGGGYLKGHPQLGRFYLFLLFFMGSMLGVVLASNVISLFVFWELTSFSSYGLIGFIHEKERSRAAALQALLVTSLGGLVMLVGLILLGNMGGSFELTQLILQDSLSEHPFYVGALLLILAGAFTKSAQFPFHFWLPGAMEAPTPVSAYLHSATMVKAGVYLMARLNPALGDTTLWLYLVGGIGLVTMVVGAYLALAHTDLKKLLAYTTVMALGQLTMLIGLGTELAIQAMVVFLLVHALYKAALFMAAGSIDHETGTRDVRELGGLAGVMPLTFAASLVAALSMAGLPPLFGFVGKEIVYDATLSLDSGAALFTTFAVLANIAVVAVAGIVALRPFLGARRQTPKAPHEAPFTMWIGPALLGAGSVVFGLLPALVGPTFMVDAASAILGEPQSFELALWHGFNLPLLLSAITVASGVILYLAWPRLRTGFGIFDRLFGEVPRLGYEWTLDALARVAAWQTRTIQNGSLRWYLFVIVAFFVALTGATLLFRGGIALPDTTGSVHIFEVIVAIICAGGALVVVLARSRVAALASLGITGYALALLFVMFSAPDLALTQLFIETLSVILLTLVVIYLPPLRRSEAMPGRKRPVVRDAVVSALAGGLVTLLVWGVIANPLDMTIPEFYGENSYTEAHGRNIVNVILVDFRAIDTMGEILVLALAGIGVFTLMRLRANRARAPRVFAYRLAPEEERGLVPAERTDIAGPLPDDDEWEQDERGRNS